MHSTIHRAAFAAILSVVLLPVAHVHAQLGDLLNKVRPSTSDSGSSMPGDLGGVLSGQSATAGSTGNVAGILEFCIRHNYLKGDAASSVKNMLMGKLSSGSPKSDSGYGDGAKGILNSAGGQKMDLGGGGLKVEVTRQVCDKVLAQAKSLL